MKIIPELVKCIEENPIFYFPKLKEVKYLGVVESTIVEPPFLSGQSVTLYLPNARGGFTPKN